MSALVIILGGKRVDVVLSGAPTPEEIGDYAKHYAKLLAEGWTFGFGTKHPPENLHRRELARLKAS